MSKTNKLNLQTLQQLDNKSFTQKKVVVGDYEVLVDEVFRESKILNLVKETVENHVYLQENKIDNYKYAMSLILKYFTDIEMGKEIKSQLQVYDFLFDLGFINIIFDNFNDKEMKKLKDKLMQYGNNLKELVEELNKQNKND